MKRWWSAFIKWLNKPLPENWAPIGMSVEYYEKRRQRAEIESLSKRVMELERRNGL